MAYTDLFNETLDDLSAVLATITGLRIVTNPQNINPPCVFVDAPSFEAFNSNIVKMQFPIKVIGIGPGTLDNMRQLLNISAALLTKNIAVTDGVPASTNIGGQEFATYNLNINIQGQTA